MIRPASLPPRPIARSLLFLSAFLAVSFNALAATSTTWEVAGFSDFLKGRLSGVSLTADGALELGPYPAWTAPLNQPALWKLALAADGSLYAATGHGGQVLRITADGKSSPLWRADQSDIFALCLDSHGILFAGASPNGGLYRIENGKASEVWHSPGKYIWALEPAPDGSLFVGTGDAGRIYRYFSPGHVELYYETGQANVTSLALAPNGHLYAGTDPNGLLFDISAARKGAVLYDSTLPEIHSIVVDSRGVVYAAAMGGAVATRNTPSATPNAAASSAVVAASPTVITVTEASRNAASPADSDTSARALDQSKASTSSVSASAPATSNSVAEVSGVEKSAIYRIEPGGVVQNIRSSKEDNVYSLALDGSSLLFSTDDHGRVFRLQNGRITLLAEPGSGETTQLLPAGAVLYAALSNPARIIAFTPPGSGPGSYESPVHDAAASVARWGHLRWHGIDSAAGLAIRTRTGFAARPDSTWSDWSAPLSDPAHALIASPPGRFIQFRAEWPASSAARITSITVPFLSQNTAPAIHSITVTSVVNTNPAKTSTPAASASSAYSITVTDTGEAPAASTASTASQSVSRLQTTQTQISWQADDADSDKLVYSVYFRAEEANDWQLIRSRMFENTLLLDPDVFADGRYFFKVVASDAPSNAPESARQAELASTPVVIDNTPPVVTLGTPRRADTSVDIDVSAQDKTSPLRLCEYSLDAGSWQPIEALDGITDSLGEQFHLHLEKLRPGEHLLVFRVYDTANNAGLGKVVLH